MLIQAVETALTVSHVTLSMGKMDWPPLVTVKICPISILAQLI